MACSVVSTTGSAAWAADARPRIIASARIDRFIWKMLDQFCNWQPSNVHAGNNGQANHSVGNMRRNRRRRRHANSSRLAVPPPFRYVEFILQPKDADAYRVGVYLSDSFY